MHDERMRVKIWPYKPGDGGIACMPPLDNVPVPNKTDWILTTCPKCSRGCWETETCRNALSNDPGMTALCTHCALLAGMTGKGGNS